MGETIISACWAMNRVEVTEYDNIEVELLDTQFSVDSPKSITKYKVGKSKLTSRFPNHFTLFYNDKTHPLYGTEKYPHSDGLKFRDLNSLFGYISDNHKECINKYNGLPNLYVNGKPCSLWVHLGTAINGTLLSIN